MLVMTTIMIMKACEGCPEVSFQPLRCWRLGLHGKQYFYTALWLFQAMGSRGLTNLPYEHPKLDLWAFDLASPARLPQGAHYMSGHDHMLEHIVTNGVVACLRRA